MEELNYAMQEKSACDVAQTIQRSSPLQNLKAKKQVLEQKLQSINDAIGALEANPEIERVMTLVAKASY